MIRVDKDPTELTTVIARAVEMVEPLAVARGRLLDLSLPTDPLRVDGCAYWFEQKRFGGGRGEGREAVLRVRPLLGGASRQGDLFEFST
jgi:hypothetical protein